jgi:hypothetical protein
MKHHSPLPPLERLKKMLELDQSTPSGLRWRISTGCVSPGVSAGSLKENGYWHLMLDGKRYYSHRIVWAIANNADPGELEIDHIDGNRSNNHPSNLRLATSTQNNRNQVNRRTDNTSGTPGVCWHKPTQKWRARICIDKGELYLGLFACKHEAIKARREAELKHFGEFAPIREQ